MKNPVHEHIDDLIVAAVRQRRSPLYARDVVRESERLERRVGRLPFRIIDGRLQALRKDAERYRWLSRQNWWSSDMFVVTGGAQAVKLGGICPSGLMLDAKIDSAMAQEGRA